MHVSFRKSAAFRYNVDDCAFEEVSCDQLSWSLTDVGTMYGAILVERLRTYGGNLVDVQDHSDRMIRSASALGINPALVASQFEPLCVKLLDQNRELISRSGDVGLVLLLSPGELESRECGVWKRPTFMAHLSPLPFGKLAQWYEGGVKLNRGSHSVVPSSCWPTQMKTRSRLPYLLSDLGIDSTQTDSLAVVPTLKGTVADTSVANLIMIDREGNLHSPPKSDILVGCTFSRVESLLAKHGVEITFRDIEFDELLHASEIVLTGTNGGVWHAHSFEGKVFENKQVGSRVQWMTKLWQQHVGFDFVAEAKLRTAKQ
jgi:branched-subunit amino acid aminotransferase/4-amino-4-deoxychorismate lyase